MLLSEYKPIKMQFKFFTHFGAVGTGARTGDKMSPS